MILVQESGNSPMTLPFVAFAIVGAIAGAAGAYAGNKKSKKMI